MNGWGDAIIYFTAWSYMVITYVANAADGLEGSLEA